jgi:hypothetical protein
MSLYSDLDGTLFEKTFGRHGALPLESR